MTPSLPSASLSVAAANPGSAAGRRDRWYSGLTWKGLALVYGFSLLSALRYNAPPPWESLLSTVVKDSFRWLVPELPIVVAVVATMNFFPLPGRRQTIALGTAVLMSATTFIAVMMTTATFIDEQADPITLYGISAFGAHFFGAFVRLGTLGGLFAAAYAWYRNEARSVEALHRTSLAQTQLDAQLGEARLQVLQAQIEPHFLFNTLATVRRLYQTDSAAATSMLDNLMRYLAVALPQMRAHDSTLGREAALAEAYLNIQKIRMGRRLAFEIAVPEALRPARMPPMMLITLVENAIKHGLNPLPEGGFVRIAARAENGRLEVEVADTGAGFTKSFGGGTGLANVRARLGTLYGAAGRLALSANTPRGVTMTLTLPHLAAAPAGGEA